MQTTAADLQLHGLGLHLHGHLVIARPGVNNLAAHLGRDLEMRVLAHHLQKRLLLLAGDVLLVAGKGGTGLDGQRISTRQGLVSFAF